MGIQPPPSPQLAPFLQQTGGQTDKASYRVACPQLKRVFSRGNMTTPCHVGQYVGMSVCPSHFWIWSSFCITALAQPTRLPCIRPCSMATWSLCYVCLLSPLTAFVHICTAHPLRLTMLASSVHRLTLLTPLIVGKKFMNVYLVNSFNRNNRVWCCHLSTDEPCF